jgi:hypothetical protein
VEDHASLRRRLPHVRRPCPHYHDSLPLIVPQAAASFSHTVPPPTLLPLLAGPHYQARVAVRGKPADSKLHGSYGLPFPIGIFICKSM